MGAGQSTEPWYRMLAAVDPAGVPRDLAEIGGVADVHYFRTLTRAGTRRHSTSMTADAGGQDSIRENARNVSRNRQVTCDVASGTSKSAHDVGSRLVCACNASRSRSTSVARL